MEWYYAKQGQQLGPISLEELQGKFASGEVGPADLVWKEGMPEWLAASSVPDLQASMMEQESGSPDPPEASRPDSQLSAAPPVSAGSAPQSPSVSGAQAVSQPDPGLAQGMPQGTPGLSVASLVCGILGILTCGPGIILGLAAVVCGHMQMGRYKQTPGKEEGKGLAIAGLILGYLAIIGGLLMIAYFVVVFTFAVNAPGPSGPPIGP